LEGVGAGGGCNRQQSVGEQHLARGAHRLRAEPDELVLEPADRRGSLGGLGNAQRKLAVAGKTDGHGACHGRFLVVVPIMTSQVRFRTCEWTRRAGTARDGGSLAVSYTPQVTSTPLACASFSMSISGHVRWPRET